VISLDKNPENGLLQGVKVIDKFSGQEIDVKGRGIINAAGIFVDSIHRMDDPERKNIIAPSQGVHIVLDKSFLPGKSAIMVPHTEDGRVLFAVPWFDHVIVGTTDTKIDKPVLEPVPFDHEIEFILSHAAKYLTKDPKPSDVLSVFAGIRPLVDTADSDEKTSALARDHNIIISPSGLITIAGGKWTTYRKMAEDTVDHAFVIAGLEKKVSRTEHLNLNGWSVDEVGNAPYALYGSNAKYIKKIVEENKSLDKKIHERLPYRFSEVVWAVREEMAFTLEDVLSRRTRSLILDARASLEAAPEVVAIMAEELGKDDLWQKEQLEKYSQLAKGYLL
jgi:glycerol-3-phosphate dehydrogenase